MKLTDDTRIITPGRALFSAIGLKRVYSAKPCKITQADFAKSPKLEPEIYTAVGEFLDGKRAADPLPEIEDFDETKNLLYQQMTPEQISQRLAQFQGNPQGDAFAKIATDARNFLAAKVPRRIQRVAAFGRAPQDYPPSRMELIIFRRFLTTVQNPAWAVRQLLAGTLSRDHIEALQAVWPDVLKAADRAAQEGFADRLEKDAKYQLSRRQARQMGVLLGKPDTPSDFVSFMQSQFITPEASPEKPMAPDEKPDDSLKTSVQRVSESW